MRAETILNRLIADGWKDVFIRDSYGIIVNNRGDIDANNEDGPWQIYDRRTWTKETGSWRFSPTDDIEQLVEWLEKIWTKD